MNEEIIPTVKICPRCGKNFKCFHARGCWCFDYTLSPENIELLKKNFSNCLCPECLALYAEKPYK